MEPVATLSTEWVLWFVNEFAAETRNHSGETNDPYPDPRTHLESPPALTTYDEAECAAIADAAFEVFAASPDHQAMATALQRLFPTPIEVRPVAIDEQIELTFTTSGGFALGPEIARGLIETLADHRVHGLGVCEADRCVDVYADRSRQRNRRFCSTICQVRSRVARHREA